MLHQQTLQDYILISSQLYHGFIDTATRLVVILFRIVQPTEQLRGHNLAEYSLELYPVDQQPLNRNSEPTGARTPHGSTTPFYTLFFRIRHYLNRMPENCAVPSICLNIVKLNEKSDYNPCRWKTDAHRLT